LTKTRCRKTATLNSASDLFEEPSFHQTPVFRRADIYVETSATPAPTWTLGYDDHTHITPSVGR